MSNMISSKNEYMSMSGGSMSMFINILCLSGGRIAAADSQKRIMVFLAEKNQSVCGLGTAGFDIAEIPWDKATFDEDKAFLLNVIRGARLKLGWETLGYQPNEEFAAEYLDKLEKLIETMTTDDIRDDSLSDWLADADDNDPINNGFPKCKIHDTYISIHGCQVCTD